MRDDLTVVYYTCNREEPQFEARIRRSLLHASRGLPIISVSHKPIDLGTNICVGDVGISGLNAWRQFQIGVKAAKTKYVCPAEADMLYPKEFFRFVPPRDDIFYLAPLYVCFSQRGYGKYFAEKNRRSESAMIVNRDFVLARLDEMYKDLPMWGPDFDHIWLLGKQPKEFFELPVPVVTFKTDRNMHRKTPHKVEDKIRELPGHGNVRELIGRYFG